MIRWMMAAALLCRVGAALGQNEILLHASTALVHGERLRYEPETNKICLGFWTNPADWAEWNFKVETPAVYELEVWQGCGKGNGGSDVLIESAGQTFDFVVDETGHFQSFIPRRLGRIHFARAGDYNLAIKPQNKKAAAVMDIRQIRLVRIPAAGESSLETQMLSARRIVFLGDSITYGGEYIEFLEAYLRLANPLAEFDILNLGLPSETLSGLSEPGHAGGAFPRPDLHERLDRILEKAKPDLIFACYGMNDGIYHPLSEERFGRFRDGIMKLRAKAKAAGARVVHLTPPTFDPMPIRDRTLPAGRAEYRQPYTGYNEVLDSYSQWLVSQHADGWEVIDIHTPMNALLAERRQADPNFRFANDGVHAGREAYWLMTETMLGRFHDESRIWKELSPRGPEILALVQNRHRLRRDAWLNEIGHKRPGMSTGRAVDEAEKEAAELARQIAALQDPQFPGKRMLWNGFETALFTVDGKPVHVAVPKRPLLFAPWIQVENFDDSNVRWAGSGFHLVKTAANAGETLHQRFGLADESLSSGIFASLRTKPSLQAGPRDESNRPLIRKLGSVDLDLVETTPLAISNRLWRFEWVRDGYWDNPRKTNYFRFRNPKSGEVTRPFADGHEFGSAFMHDGTVYVTGTFGRDQINVFASKDLQSWEKWNAIPGGKYGIFNTSICRAGEEFVMMFEIDKPAEEAGAAFTARFARSKDLRRWTMTPPECNYAKDRYTAPHALRWLDGWFYNFYLEAHEGYEMRVVRSRDLIRWLPSPLNPVLRASQEDRRIASPAMPDAHRARVANAVNLNNSDIDFCEFGGRLHITYSWGNQQGMEHLAAAIYDGSEAEFLRGWFPGE